VPVVFAIMMLLIIVSSIVVTIGVCGGVIIRVFTWVYAESNNLRSDISRLRAEVAQTYVTLESQKIIKEAIDQRGDQLEGAVKGLSAAVDRLSDRQDKSLAELIKALAAKLSS